MNLEEIKKSMEAKVLGEKGPKKIRLLQILLIACGIILFLRWCLIKLLADVIPLAKLLWPLAIGAIILGIALAIWRWFAEQVKALWGVDLFRKMSQTVLLGLVYLLFFYFSYGWLAPKLMENTGFSHYHTLMIVTALQLPMAGALCFLFSPIWPERGKAMRGFMIISLIGPLAIAYIMYQNPNNFFDHQTGECGIWISDSEEKIYYSPGYGIEDGKPLRPATAADIEKFKKKKVVFRGLDKLIAGAEAKAEATSGIFKLPANGMITDKDVNGREIRYRKGERIQLQQLNSPPESLTFINHHIPSWTIRCENYISGPAISDGKVELAAGGKAITVYVRVIPPN